MKIDLGGGNIGKVKKKKFDLEAEMSKLRTHDVVFVRLTDQHYFDSWSLAREIRLNSKEHIEETILEGIPKKNRGAIMGALRENNIQAVWSFFGSYVGCRASQNGLPAVIKIKPTYGLMQRLFEPISGAYFIVGEKQIESIEKVEVKTYNKK